MGGLLAEEAEPTGLVTPAVRPIGLVGLVTMPAEAATAAALAVLRVSLPPLLLSTSGSDMSWN